MKKINISFLLIILMVVAFLVGYGSKNGISAKLFNNKKAETLAQKAVDYINFNFFGLTEEEGGATLVSVVEESGVYKFKMKIDDIEYDSFVTKDGKILFPEGITMQEEEQEVAQTCEDLSKKEQPVLKAFVVSYCPFGTQMLRILNEIVKNIPELSNYIKVAYMGEIQNGQIAAMHGDEEAEENLRQICIRDEQKDKYWQYIDCFLKEGEAQECLVSASVDTNALEQCMQDEFKGIKYAQGDFDDQDKYEVTGSPTLILNEENVSEFDFGGRTAEAVKTVICCGFNTAPEFCSQVLTEEQAAAGFSPSYEDLDLIGGNANCE
ncbi:MAG: hypothetical protein PHG13_01100 [Candidatus Pacebacteria bacterium]|nr:hypothetical protein [Candidatus Paceibacterota bacterium]MDD5721986.1 hypothetical protein [Candidatus Paceibacterota bacterium]